MNIILGLNSANKCNHFILFYLKNVQCIYTYTWFCEMFFLHSNNVQTIKETKFLAKSISFLQNPDKNRNCTKFFKYFQNDHKTNQQNILCGTGMSNRAASSLPPKISFCHPVYFSFGSNLSHVHYLFGQLGGSSFIPRPLSIAKTNANNLLAHAESLVPWCCWPNCGPLYKWRQLRRKCGAFMAFLCGNDIVSSVASRNLHNNKAKKGELGLPQHWLLI